MTRLTMGIRRSSLIGLALFCIFATNFITCFATINVASYVKLPREDRFVKRSTEEVCHTPTCKETAATILNNMDKSVEPCDDFYHFACGNFIKTAVIPEHEVTNNLFTKVNENVTQQLESCIKNEITESDPEAFKLVKSFYDICMNEDQIKKNSENELLEILNNLGGWPVLIGESWDESKFDWKESTYKFREAGYAFNSIVGFGAGPDMKNNTKNRIYIDQASLGLEQEVLAQGSEQEIVKAYHNYSIEFAKLFGADPERARREMTETLNFEIELAKISKSSTERRNLENLYNPMTIQELENKYPYIPWLEYLNKLLSPEARVEATDVVIVDVPSYFESLDDLLAKTPSRVLANYLYWQVAASSAGQMSERVLQLGRDFGAVMTGRNTKTPRTQVCVGQVQKNFEVAVGALYVRRYVSKETKESALDMVQKLRDTFGRMLKDLNWMDDGTKEDALEKLEKMIPFVGYPDEFFDDEKISGYYESLKLYPESYLKTTLSISSFGLKRLFEKFNKPIDKKDWTTHANSFVVNAFYNPLENSINFPAAILQGLFFNKDNPKYLNYAGIGSIVGHEITHGFDDMGRTFDKDGNLHDWWDPATKQKFLEKAQCIIAQYSNYTVKDVGAKLNGELKQGENIADNGGTKEAYIAYGTWEKENGVEPKLPGLESYSSKQMFWIGNANVWCNKYRLEYLKNVIMSDTHTPNEFRIIGTFSNLPEFSKDFSCPLGSRMNPVHKCTVW